MRGDGRGGAEVDDNHAAAAASHSWADAGAASNGICVHTALPRIEPTPRVQLVAVDRELVCRGVQGQGGADDRAAGCAVPAAAS